MQNINKDSSEKKKLKEYFNVITGKKDANASNEKGEYAFFTCSKQISKIDKHSFDGSAILLAGNGDFNVKVYEGKFDAYQRTYVLMPHDTKYLGFLYFAITNDLNRLTSGFRGSVIKFITKGMIEEFEVSNLKNEKILKIFNDIIKRILFNNTVNDNLEQLRDSLLPKLMNGEIDLDKVEI